MTHRSVVDRILASLRRADGRVEPGEGDGPLDDVQLASLCELFIAAGTEAVVRAIAAPRWLQLDVELDSPEQHSRFLHGPLAQLVGPWLDDGTLDGFFFMNKAPGCRLRLLGSAPGPLHRRATAFLDEQVQAGRAVSYGTGTYEPEVHQFGGPVGLALAHELFTIESRAVLEYGQLLDSGRTAVDPIVFSLFVVGALLRRVVGDRWEMWDAWMHMDLAGRRVQLDPARRAELVDELAEQREVLEALAMEPESLCEELDEVERPLFRRYLDGLDGFAERLTAAASSGELHYGLREILPFYIVFHWNRMRFDRGLQCTLVFYMTQVLSPKARRPPPDPS